MTLKLVKPATAASAPTWAQVRDAYSKMQQMGWQSVQQAARVGAMLIALKKDTPHGKFRTRAENELPKVSADTVERLMKLAAHLPLLEKHKPESQAQALALIPAKRARKPRASGGRIRDAPQSKSAHDDAPAENEIEGDEAFFTHDFYDVSAAMFRLMKFLGSIDESVGRDLIKRDAFQTELRTMARYASDIAAILKGLIK